MNAPFSPSALEANERDCFDRLKLRMLETFYDLDVALEDWIHDGGRKAAGASTGCRVKELAEVCFPDDIATKAQVARFARLSGELDSAIRLRNLVVHCGASFGFVEGHPTIFLRPVGHAMRANGYVALTSAEEIRVAIEQVNKAATALVAWRKQRDTKALAVKVSGTTDSEN